MVTARVPAPTEISAGVLELLGSSHDQCRELVRYHPVVITSTLLESRPFEREVEIGVRQHASAGIGMRSEAGLENEVIFDRICD
jgi:hypothetical protein